MSGRRRSACQAPLRQARRRAASIGAVTFTDMPRELEEAIRLADELPYRAKRAGRNRVAHATVNDRASEETAARH